MAPAAVDVRGLGFTYPDGHQALHDVDLHVDAGQRVALLGPNGAGKTTLALHLNGIHRTATGIVAIGDTVLDDASLPDLRRRVGLVFQDPDDQLFMPSVRDDVGFGPANLGITGGDLDRRIMAALADVGAADLVDRSPHHLSGGERRRVALATVLSMAPEVLVLDEPTSGLDPAGCEELVEVLVTLDQTLLVITHDLPFALQLCDRSVIMDGGHIVADGPTRDLLADQDLLHRHRLRLPFGLDPSTLA